jgi:hypothetical protein
MLCGEGMTVYSESHTKRIIVLWGQNIEFLNINVLKPSGNFTYDQV